MIKRIAVATVCLAASVGVGITFYPTELGQYARTAHKLSQKLWDGIEANPIPVGLALGTFMFTVIYHKAKGKSLRESVEAAATRVTVVNVPVQSEAENAVVQRARARAIRTQLIADQIGLQNRNRRLPEAVVKAEQDLCYTEKALADAERQLEKDRKSHDKAVATLDANLKEKAKCESELAEVEFELKKLAEMV